jgi:hypothetical protein
MRSRSGRFTDLVDRQLDLFERDEAELIRDTDAALAFYNAAPREEAEERYGDYLDHVDAGLDVLLDLREAYAATLPEETDDEYREAFNDRARRRVPQFSLGL